MLQNVFTIHQAKTNLSRLLKKVANGEQVIIARGSVPVAELIPIGPAKRQRQPGLLKGKLLIGPEFFESLPEDELAAWE